LTFVSMSAAALLTTACASADAPAGAPAWYVDAINDDDAEFPSLDDVPRAHQANIDQAHWNAVAADLGAALETLRANPRNEPADPDDAAAFADEARAAIDASRDAH
jgi:hypothetical protein